MKNDAIEFDSIIIQHKRKQINRNGNRICVYQNKAERGT